MTQSTSLWRTGWRPTKREVTAVALPVLVLAADVLFFSHAIGVSLAIFLALLGLASALAHVHTSTRTERLLSGLALAFALAPLLESVGSIAVGIALAGTAAAALIASGHARAGWRESARRVAVLAIANPVAVSRIASDAQVQPKSRRLAALPRLAASWAAPLALGLGFVALFSLANPIFRSVIGMIDLPRLLAFFDPLRITLWVVVGAFTAAFLGMRFGPYSSSIAPAVAPVPTGPMLQSAMAVRCLIVFNAVFSLETGIDLTHLWANRWSGAPPTGVSYAGHAHEAAYLLVFTALLSAAFVLVATSGTKGQSPSRLMHGLIYLWVTQNVLLVLSAMLRLDIYVAAYSLTQLRFAAFVWMGLVAFGLLAIVVRIATGRDNRWLVATNLAALGLSIYVCGIVDVNRMIATFNVAHSREAGGDGMALDLDYLCELGSSALPAIDLAMASEGMVDSRNQTWHSPRYCADEILQALRAKSGDWRAWTFRDHRLRAYAAERYERIHPTSDNAEKVLDGPDDPRR